MSWLDDMKKVVKLENFEWDDDAEDDDDLRAWWWAILQAGPDDIVIVKTPTGFVAAGVQSGKPHRTRTRSSMIKALASLVFETLTVRDLYFICKRGEYRELW